MRAVTIMPAAQADMHDIVAFIATDNTFAAARVEACIYATIDKLAFMPAAREGRMAETFEKPVRGLPYIIAFD